MFESYKVFDKAPNTITIANGKQVHIEHIGTVKFGNGVKLLNMLHVPGVKFNLISTHKLCQYLCCTIVFTKDECLPQGYSQRESVVLDKMNCGLYAMSETESSKSVNVAVCEEDAKLWHLRYGHLPFTKLHLVCPNVIKSAGEDCICQICPRAKQTRLPFPKCRTTVTNKCFELVHIDVWGPYKSFTYDGFNMFFTLVDDFSRHTWIF
ncbi:Retrovirus-related Pol polyprotein from transposon RE1 [Bienertia sinuspersici]